MKMEKIMAAAQTDGEFVVAAAAAAANHQQQQEYHPPSHHHSRLESHGVLVDRDHGHRYGNFPNYSTFHPPHARLQVLESNGILHYIRRGLVQHQQQQQFRDRRIVPPNEMAGGLQLSTRNDNDNIKDNEEIKRREKNKGHKRPRVTTTTEECDFSSTLKSAAAPNLPYIASNIIYYCDLGCNSGELTAALAASLLLIDDGATNDDEVVGQQSMVAAIHVLGMDLDPTLVKRANANFSVHVDSSTVSESSSEVNINNNHIKSMYQTSGANNSRIKANCMVCDLTLDIEHNAICASFLENVDSDDGLASAANEEGGVGEIGCKDDNSIRATNGNQKQVVVASPRSPLPTNEPQCRRLFHLTTIFSTTMWIHVHSGDNGLRSFLERACHWTALFLLVEPQPSGW
jgi:hypothetical protein